MMIAALDLRDSELHIVSGGKLVVPEAMSAEPFPGRRGAPCAPAIKRQLRPREPLEPFHHGPAMCPVPAAARHNIGGDDSAPGSPSPLPPYPPEAHVYVHFTGVTVLLSIRSPTMSGSYSMACGASAVHPQPRSVLFCSVILELTLCVQ